MAMIDYGTLVFLNGKQVNKDMFMGMSEIGITKQTAIDKTDWVDEPVEVNMQGNNFAFAGDDNFYLAFYKNIIRFVENGDITRYVYSYNYQYDGRRCKRFKPLKFETDSGAKIIIRSYDGYGQRFFVTMQYKGNTWKIVTGYGIDTDDKIFDSVWRRYGVTQKEYTKIQALKHK